MAALLTVQLKQEFHVVLARQRARQIAALLGFDAQDQTRIATAVSEVARNAVQHGGGGVARYSLEPGARPRYVIAVRDAGPGIADLSDVLSGSYRTDRGLASGLVGSRRLMEQFAIESVVEQGTTVTLGAHLPRNHAPVTPQWLGELAEQLHRTAPEDPILEIQHQNQELLRALDEEHARQEDVERLNRQLAETNEELQERQELLRQLNDELEGQRLRLEEADQRKNQFLAVLGHELRNPLAAACNAQHLLQFAEEGAEPANRHQEIIARQLQHLSRLVDDLLDVSRINRGKIELRREPIFLDEAIEVAVQATRALIEERGLELIVEPAEEPVLLDADLARLCQVIANLLNNAAKYSDRGGSIRLTAEVEPAAGMAVLRVRDQGIGIAPDLLPHIFEIFTQADHTPGRAEGGLGIGLSLVRLLVELHGGQVTASSEGFARGSEIVVRLPLARSTRSEARETGNGYPAALPASRPLRVLVVDDNVDGAETLADILAHWGHQAQVVHDGHGALAAAASSDFDALVLDIGLPDVDGYEIARRLRASDRHAATLLIALTGYGQAADRQRAAESGFDHHLTKPVDPQALRSLLSSGAAKHQVPM